MVRQLLRSETSRLLRRLAISVAVVLGGSVAVVAATATVAGASSQETCTWTGTGTGTGWSTAGNWDCATGTVPVSTGTVVFPATTGVTQRIATDDMPGLTGMSVELSGTGSSGYTISGTTIGLGTGGISDTQSSASTISASLTVSATVPIDTTMLSTLTLFGSVDGSGSLTIAGTGAVALGSSGTLAGTTTVDTGATLLLESARGAGTSTIDVLSGGTLSLRTGAAPANTLDLAGTLDIAGSGGYYSGPITLTGDATMANYTTCQVFEITGVLSGSGSVSFDPSDCGIRLTATNTYGGTTTLATGLLEVANSTALSQGAVAVASTASLFLTGSGISVPNDITMAAGGGGVARIYSTGSPVSLTGTLTLATTAEIVPYGGGTFQIQGAISGDGGLYVTGTVELDHVDNTYSGGTTVYTGSTAIDTATGAFGTGSITVFPGGALELRSAGSITLANDLGLSGSGTGGGALVDSSNGTASVTGTVTLTNLYGSAPTDVTIGTAPGAGLLDLHGPIGQTTGHTIGLTLLDPTNAGIELDGTNTYSGGTTLSSGTLTITASTALGTGPYATPGTSALVLDGSAGALSIANPLDLTGDGPTGLGALDSTGAANTVTGAIALGGPTTIGFDGNGLSLSGTISGGATLTYDAGSASGHLGIGASNSYTGNTLLEGADGPVFSTTATDGYGPSGTVTADPGVTVSVGTTATAPNPLVAETGAALVGPASGVGTWSGSVTLDGTSLSVGAGNDGTMKITGDITGTGLVEATSGTTELTGDDSSSQGVDAAGGVLQIDAGATVGPAIATAGGTIAGGGTTAALSTDTTGAVAPTSTLTASDGLFLSGTGTARFTLTGGGSSLIDVTGGSVAIGGALDVTASSLDPTTAGEIFPLVENATGTLSGTFTGLPEGSAFTTDGRSFTVTYEGGATGDDVDLIALAPPGPPTAVKAVASAGGGAATVTWTAPADTGSTPITGYTVAPSPACPSCTGLSVGGGTTSTTVGGLANGTTYTFTVTAVNGYGPPVPSSPSNAVTPTSPPTPTPTPTPTTGTGYWEVASDGGIFSFGNASFYGSMGGQPLDAPIVGMAVTPTGKGYSEVASDGGIFAFGDASFYGSMGGRPLDAPIVGMAVTPTGKGYWEVASDGGIFSFGNASFYGSMGGQPLDAPIVGMAVTPTGKGYWEVASDGGIFAFGDASFYGSMGGQPLDAPIVGMAVTPTGKGYWEVASDGGIFAFGDASFYGSMGGQPLVKPVVGLAPAPGGGGYWEVASDGGLFSFGDASFYGSMGGQPLVKPVVGLAVS